MKSHKPFSGPLWKRFAFAWSGLRRAFFRETNLQIQGIIAIIVIFAASFYDVTLHHWLILLIMIAMVIGLELINTALEHVVDMVTEDYHPMAKAAKDIAAGAVLFTSVIAAVIGVLIFYITIF